VKPARTGSSASLEAMRRIALGLVAWLALACHHDQAPAPSEPGKTPLPSASGTPIGYLIEAGASLNLRDEQIVRLHEIDDALSVDLARMDGKTAHPARAAGTGSGSASPSTGGRGRGGGFRMTGGRGGGRRRGGMGSTPAPASGSASAAPATAGQDRATRVREALRDAFSVLGPEQQPAAKKVLAEHDIDVDVDHDDAHEGQPGEDEPDEK
jgi:hypothetical protein